MIIDDKTYVLCISLKDDTKRRETFECGFPFIPKIFVDAVVGRHLLASDYFTLIKKAKGRAANRLPTPGEVGCFLSHLKALKQFIDSDYSKLIVFEDDVTPLHDVAEMQVEFVDNRITILGGQEGLRRPYVLDKIFNHKLSYKVPKLFTSWVYRTCGYALKRKTAQKLIAVMDQNFYLIDDWAQILSDAKIDGLYMQKLVSHPLDLSQSTIESERSYT